jgi:hypothetical protein
MGSRRAGWVREQAGVAGIAVASDATHGSLLVMLDDTGTVSSREGSRCADWVGEPGPGVSGIAVASDPTNGPLCVMLDGTGTVWSREGSRRAGWVREHGPGVGIAAASDPTNGPLLAMLDPTGTVWVKGQCPDLWAIAGASDPTHERLLATLRVVDDWTKKGSVDAKTNVLERPPQKRRSRPREQ